MAVVNWDYASVNNSQIFNNGNHGIHANGVTRLIVNNTQSYKNNGAALYATNSPYLMVNDVGFFHSPSSDLSLSNASSSVTYYWNNLIPKRSWTNIFAGSAYSNLWWTAGTLNTVTPAYDCDLVSNPVFNNSYFYASNCNFNWRNTNRTVWTNAIVKYKYGDNFWVENMF